MVLRKEKGKLYWLGENPASDAVITRGVAGGGTQILLITRAKDGKLASKQKDLMIKMGES
jgi:hypothetical protein